MSLLTIENVSKRFGGVQALAGVSLEVEEGKLTSLIGPNGSGKTTLFNLITGVYRSDTGHIQFAGRNLLRLPAHKICQTGVTRTFQIQQLFTELTVLENVMVGCHWTSEGGFFTIGIRTPGSRREERRVREEAMQILDFLGLADRAEDKANSLSYGEQRLLEIGKALAARPRLLLLDEPAAGFNKHEKARLSETLRKILRRGITVFLVEHDMSLVMSVSDHIVVFHQGEKLCSGEPKAVSCDQRVIAAYLGSDTDVPA